MVNMILRIIAFTAGLGLLFNYTDITSNLTIFDVFVSSIVIFLIGRTKKIIFSRNEGMVIFLIGIFQIISTLVSLLGITINEVNSFLDVMVGIRTVYYASIILLLNKNNVKFTHFELILIYRAYCLGLFLNVVNILYLFNLAPRYWHGLPLMSNDYLNRNMVYYPLVISISIQWQLIKLTRKIISRFVLIILLTTTMVISLLTFSKGAYLLLSLVGISILFVELYQNKKISFFPFILFVGLLVCFFNSNIYSVFVDTKMSNYGMKNDFRLYYKSDAIKIGLNNIILGCGSGNYYSGLQEIDSIYWTHDPHDVSLMLFSENGLIVWVLYEYLIINSIIKLIKCNYRPKEEKYFCLVFIISYIVLSHLTGTVFTGKIFPFLFIILEYIVNIPRYETENIRNE